MRFSEDQTGLVQALFAGAAEGEAAPWQGFLELLCRVTQADSAALAFDRERGTALVWSRGPCPMLGPELRQRLRADRVYDRDGLPGEAGTTGFLRAVQARAGVGLGAGRVTLWLHRPPHRRDFRSAEAQPLAALAPFLGQALAGWQAVQQERARAGFADALNRGLGAGWLLLDPAGLLLDASPGALAMAAEAGLRLADRRRPDLPDATLARDFRTALAACATGAAPRPLRLSQSPVIEARLTPTTLAGDPAILARLRRPLSAAALPPDSLARALGLSRSEARLAALLTDGHSLRSAAAILGWTEETARSTSKTLFSRTGQHGQPALLRHILSSAVWFGEEPKP